MPSIADDDTTLAPTDGGTPSPEGAGADDKDPQKVIEDLRKRQSGADKARDIAIAERDALQARLDAATGNKPAAPENQPTDAAAIRAQLEKEFDAKLADQKTAMQAEALDARFPVARKRFPGVTDAAQLAELEEFYGEPPAAPKPIGNNPQGGGAAKSLESMSIKELRAELDKQAAGLLGAKS